MSLKKLSKNLISLTLVLAFLCPLVLIPAPAATAAFNSSIAAPSGASLDANRIILRVQHTWLTAVNYPRWVSDYTGADALSLWYTDDGTDPYKENPSAMRIRINPAVSASGSLAAPRAYILDYTGGTTYKFICYNGADWGSIYTYTTALNAPRLSIDNNINPASTNNVLRLTSGLYKRSDVAGGIRLFSDAEDAVIRYQTAPCTWNPATSDFSTSSVDSVTAATLQSSGIIYSDANPISAAGLNETNAIAIRATVVKTGLTTPTPVTFKIRVTDDANFITLKADKNGNFLVDLDAFIAQLTREEKLMICGGVGGDPIWLQNGYNFPIESNNDGILRTGGPAGGTPALPRFNIPSTVLADGPAGVRMWKNATIWMCPAGVGATWNSDLAVLVGERYAAEAKHYAVDYVLGPGINNQRNPLSGRNFEYYSEDPYILGLTAAYQVKGMQDNGLAATLKHFAANDYESGRSNSAYASERALREIYLRAFQIAVEESDPWCIMTGYNGINGTATARNNWLTTEVLRGDWGFRGFVMTDWGGDAGTASLQAQTDMSQSAARALGTYNTWLNTATNLGYLNRSVKNILGILVKTFAFQGEYGVLQPNGTYVDGYKLDGSPAVGLTREDIGSRHLEFGSSQVQKDSRVVNKQVADEAIVLMKNKNNVLPLKGNEKVALVTSRKAWQEFFNPRWYGDSASVGDVVLQGTGSAQVRFNNSTEDYAMTLVEALNDRGFDVVDWKIDFGALGNNNQAFLNAFYNNLPKQGGKKYVFSEEQAAGATAEVAAYTAANGLPLATARANAQAAAAAAAAAADVGMFVITRISGESADVTQALYDMEPKELLVYDAYEKAFHAAGKPLIVLINVGGTTNTVAYRGGTLTAGSGANAVTATTDGADAILDIWNPGSAGTEAVADILKGTVNPSGRLAQTFPVNFNDSPSVYMFTETNNARREQGLAVYPGNGYNNNAYYADGVYVGYRFYESRPQNYATMVAYPFGYGLSYTKFEYSNLKLDKNNIADENGRITATVDVKNTGEVAGKEVVQLYLSASTWQEEGRPKNDLRAYGKTKLLAPGETETIALTIKFDDLLYFEDANPTGTLNPLPTFGRGEGWTVADDTVFTVTVRTNGSEAAAPNQPISGLTATFFYGVDKSALIEEIKNAPTLQGGYTDRSWQAMLSAIAAAEAVVEDEDATQAAVDNAQAALIASIKGLRIWITSVSIKAPALVTVVRGATYTFEAEVSEGAFADILDWTVGNTTFATVNADGSVTILNKTGSVILTAKDPDTNISNSIILRIV